MLIGVVLISGCVIGEMAIPVGQAHKYIEYQGDSARLFMIVSMLTIPGALSLLAGIVLWLLSYRLDRKR